LPRAFAALPRATPSPRALARSPPPDSLRAEGRSLAVLRDGALEPLEPFEPLEPLEEDDPPPDARGTACSPEEAVCGRWLLELL